VAELAVTGLPSLLIPFPQAAHNHQTFNARQFEQAGAGILVEQKNLAAADLGRLLPQLLSDPSHLESMSQAAKKLAQPLAAQTLVNELESLASGPGNKDLSHAR
jgi:UDP-N-acetylglucosamine--N-acetylmuramyl-(pentapeptide) pyrophosphoryl-undecaprenol N-acetylglucosamine transferase